jgi:hypothetical protein
MKTEKIALREGMGIWGMLKHSKFVISENLVTELYVVLLCHAVESTVQIPTGQGDSVIV